MVNGAVVGIVVDNVDPDKMGRIKVKFPVDAESAPETTWVRMSTPMGGKGRGLVMLPEKDSEVLVGFAYRTLTPYLLGAVFNGAADKPPYTNDDAKNHHRRFHSRSGHALDFGDEGGQEAINLATGNGGVATTLDDAKKTLTIKCEKDVAITAKETLSLKCKTLEITASETVSIKAGTTGVAAATTGAHWTSTTTQDWTAASVSINGGSPGEPATAMATPAHKHPPTTA